MHRILIVPDSLLDAEIGSSFLDRSIFSVRAAASGEEALGIAAAWRPDLVLFGSLPDMSASVLAARVRQAAGSEIKLFLLTDSVEPADGGEADPELDARLVVPVDPTQVLITMAALLDVRVRRAPRVGVRILAQTEQLADEEERPLANILSLSERGALLESPCHLRIGAVGSIRFVLPAGSRRLTVAALVQVLIDEVQLHYGVTFVNLESSDQAEIRSFVYQRLGREPPGAAR